MKIEVEIEVPDNFEPFTIGCADICPFGYWYDYMSEMTCEYGESNCPLLKAIKNKTNS